MFAGSRSLYTVRGDCTCALCRMLITTGKSHRCGVSAHVGTWPEQDHALSTIKYTRVASPICAHLASCLSLHLASLALDQYRECAFQTAVAVDDGFSLIKTKVARATCCGGWGKKPRQAARRKIPRMPCVWKEEEEEEGEEEEKEAICMSGALAVSV
ncbi:uncharacterized protein B0I36DRAFT_327835 [Microdochium trichocladiopsis]|uniref:Uncharacterized protein n=1 Tax=Microdochium trichocladiopsis TaxID=1682393 RepID=A0A9P9BNS8_9PEZI|nr:uncharacterized protein B0I36DRAFT_327835 [Microdochium trichocladiopsis]KAH7027759.1 hypothetical protein B0I36DRAFT_327835 [Microdochium trichocladiopsis]